jgi:hypothetical protein
VAKSVRLALSGELVPDAVNVQGGVLAEPVRPLLPLAEKLGAIACKLSVAAIERIDIEVQGEAAAEDVRVLELSALKGVFGQLVDDPVSYVNAPLMAKARGVEVHLSRLPRAQITACGHRPPRRWMDLTMSLVRSSTRASPPGAGRRVRCRGGHHRSHGVPGLHRPSGRRRSPARSCDATSTSRDKWSGHRRPGAHRAHCDSAVPNATMDTIVAEIGAGTARPSTSPDRWPRH